MAAFRTVFRRQALTLLLFLLLFVGLPLYLSTDSAMTWLYEKARRDHWDSAPIVTYTCAEYYQWTGRNQRSVEVFEVFLTHWSDHPKAPEALLYGAAAIQATMNEMQQREVESPEREARIQAARDKAILWLETLGNQHRNHPFAERALRSAEVMKEGQLYAK